MSHVNEEKKDSVLNGKNNSIDTTEAERRTHTVDNGNESADTTEKLNKPNQPVQPPVKK